MPCLIDLGRCVLLPALVCLFAPAPFPRPTTAYLGIDLRPGAGLTVASSYVSSPAALANLGRGDVLVAIDGTALRTEEELAAFLKRKKPGEMVTLTVRRDNQVVKATVRLGTRGLVPYVGANIGLQGNSILVTGVPEGTPAQRAGLRVNDRVLAMDGIELNGLAAVVEFLRKKMPGDEVSVLVRRDNAEVRLRLTLGDRPGH